MCTSNVERPELVGTAELGQIDDEARMGHLGTGAPEELHSRDGRAAGGNQIVDQQHPVAFIDGIGMHLDGIHAIFKRVVLTDGLAGQLAALADRHEADAERNGHRRPEDEAARLDAGHMGDAQAAMMRGGPLDRLAETHGILDQRGDVAEHDPRLGIVGDGADQALEINRHVCLQARNANAAPASFRRRTRQRARTGPLCSVR